MTCSTFPNWEILVVFLVFCWNRTKDNFMFINDSTRKTMQNYFVQQRCRKRELWTNSMVTMVTQNCFFFPSPLLRGYIWIVFIVLTGKLLTYESETTWVTLHIKYFVKYWKWQPIPVFLPKNIPWAEEPGEPWSMESQRVRYNWAQTYLAITLHPVLWMKEGAAGHCNSTISWDFCCGILDIWWIVS